MSLNVNNKRPDALRLAAEFFCDNDPAFAFRILQKCDVTEEQIGKIQEMIKAAGLASAPEENRMRIANIRDRIVAALDTHLCFPSPFTSASGCFYSDKPFEFGGKWYTTLFHCVYTQMYRDQPKLVNLIAQCDTLDEVLEFVKLHPMTEKCRIMWENSQDKDKSEEGIWMHACRAQFSQIPELKAALEATKKLFLVCDGPELDLSNGWTSKGENAFGRRLMKLRKEYRGIGEDETLNASYHEMIKKRNKKSQFLISSFLPDIWENILAQGNTGTVASLLLLNRASHQGILNATGMLMPMDTLMKICSPNLQIIFTGPRIIPEFDKFKVIKLCHLLKPIADRKSLPFLTLLVKEPNLTLEEISGIAKEGKIKLDFGPLVGHTEDLKKHPTPGYLRNKKSVVLMTNSLIEGTENLSSDDQYRALRRIQSLINLETLKKRCVTIRGILRRDHTPVLLPGDEKIQHMIPPPLKSLECSMPGILDLITLFVCTKLNHGHFPWSMPLLGCSSTVLVNPYYAPITITASIEGAENKITLNIVDDLRFIDKNRGASGIWELEPISAIDEIHNSP